MWHDIGKLPADSGPMKNLINILPSKTIQITIIYSIFPNFGVDGEDHFLSVYFFTFLPQSEIFLGVCYVYIAGATQIKPQECDRPQNLIEEGSRALVSEDEHN